MTETTRDDTRNHPDAGFWPPIGPRREYSDLKQAVEQYLDAADRDSQLTKAIAAMR